MTYNDLHDMNNQDLIDIGIPILKHRKDILRAARQIYANQLSSGNKDNDVDPESM